MVIPIFILSLPRSGSTLLQQLVATHPAVATASEPWLLLPLFLAYRDEHVFASYQQRFLVQAFHDFLGQLPNGAEAYRSAVRQFAAALYEQACSPEQTHFLDKTLRYHLIAENLFHTFPEARWILLWRNPLAVVASYIDTWGRGHWNLHHYRLDLFHGLPNLINTQRSYKDRLFRLRYEDLVEDPDTHVQAIFQYVGLAPFAEAGQRYKDVRLGGRMGDKKGEQVFSAVSTAPRDKWITSLATLPRRAWVRRYLSWLGRERLAEMGYDQDDLLAQLTAHPLNWRHTFSDLVGMCYGRYTVFREPALFRRKRALARREFGWMY